MSPDYLDYGLLAGLNYGGDGSLLLFTSGGRVRVPIETADGVQYFFLRNPQGVIYRSRLDQFEGELSFRMPYIMYGSIPATSVADSNQVVSSIDLLGHHFVIADAYIPDDDASIYDSYGIIEGILQIKLPNDNTILALVYNGEIFPMISATDPETGYEDCASHLCLNEDNEVVDFDTMLRNAPRYIVGDMSSQSWSGAESVLMSNLDMNVHPVVCADSNDTPYGDTLNLIRLFKVL